MDGSDKLLSPSSTPIKLSQTPKDENKKRYQEMGSNVQNPKKPTTTKHYMSPTISAASKATLPRKKILAENNHSFDTHLQKTPSLETSQESLSQNTPCQGSELDENEQNIALGADSASKAILPRKKILAENNHYFDTHLRKTPSLETSQESLSQHTPRQGSELDENEQNIALVADSASKAILPRKKILAENKHYFDTHLQKTPSFETSQESLSHNTPCQGSELDENEQNSALVADSACKAIIPRKKILAENNHSFDAHLQKTPSLETYQESLSQNTPRQDSELAENEQNIALVADSASKPYDPVTNYLSPRPKFLCYKPNRREEILLRRENEKKEGTDGLSISSNASFDSKKDISEEDTLVSPQEASICSSIDGSMKQEDEEFDEDDDEFEEIEEGGGWGFIGLLKFLLLLVSLVVCTSYTSSMNSPTPSSSVQAVKSLEDKYYVIQHNVYNLVKSFQDGSHLLNGAEGTVVDGGIEEEEENTDDLSEMAESQREEIEGLEMLKVEKNGELDKLNEVAELLSGENEAVEADVGEIKEKFDELSEVEEIEGLEMLKFEKNGEVDKLNEVAELLSGKNEAVEADVGEKEEKFDELSEVMEPRAAETNDDCDNEMARIEEIVEDVVPQVTKAVEGLVSTVSSEHVKENEVVMEPLEIVNNVETNQADDDMDETENITNDYLNFEIVNPESVPSSKDGLISHVGSELYLKVVIGFFAFCAIVASLVFGFRVMNKRHDRKDSSVVLKPCAKSVMAGKSNLVQVSGEKKNVPKESYLVAEPYAPPVIAEKSNLVQSLNEDKILEEDTRSVESFAKSRSLVNSLKDDPSESFKSRTPAVEFLGEFVVGEVCSSMRSRDMKNRMVESEVSSHSVSVAKGHNNKANSMHADSQPAFSESSNIVSAYGSFTTEKRILKKKKREIGDGDGDVEITTTPVRRSSRLQNRAIVSP